MPKGLKGFQDGNTEASKHSKGGRKSAYEEYGRAKALAEAFFEGVDADKAIKLLQRLKVRRNKNGDIIIPKKNIGKVKGIDVYIAKAIFSNDSLLADIARKLMPDKFSDDTPPGKTPAQMIMDRIFKNK